MEDFNKTIDNLEDALSSGTINEGQYIKLMDMAKQRYEKAKGVEEEEEEMEVEVIEEMGEFNFCKVEDRNLWLIGAEEMRYPMYKFYREEEAIIMWQTIKKNFDSVARIYRGENVDVVQN